MSLNDGRKNINKHFLVNTIQNIDYHNRIWEEEKCWKEREKEKSELNNKKMKRKQKNKNSDVKRSKYNQKKPQFHVDINELDHKSRKTSKRKRNEESMSTSMYSSDESLHSNGNVREINDENVHKTSLNNQNTNEINTTSRDYWAKRKAERTQTIWNNKSVQNRPLCMIDNAPSFLSSESSGSESSDYQDTKTKHKKKKKHKKKDKRKKKKHKTKVA